MKLGIHAMAWTSHWSDESLPLVDRVAGLGLDFVEIPLMDVEDVHPAPIRKRLDAAGIDVVTSTVLSEATDITSPDPQVRDAGVDYLRRCVDVTAELGATQFSGVIYGMHGKRPRERPNEQDWAWSAECLARTAEHATRNGVAVGIEPVNRYESPLVNTCEQAVWLAELIDAPNLRIHLDTYHMNIEEPGMAAAIEAAGDRLGYFHVGESNRGPLGTGTIDFGEAFAALDRIGYDGTITFESFSSAVVSPALTRALCIWRETWDDGMELATSARRFVAEQLAAANA
jgi:D-psicose/D-tagatose/L-ribulose 3-epimerase